MLSFPSRTVDGSPSSLTLGSDPTQCGAAGVRQSTSPEECHDCHTKERVLEVGDAVFARNYSAGDKWIPGVISMKSGPLSYHVTLTDDRVVRRHVDQLQKRTTPGSVDQSDNNTSESDSLDVVDLPDGTLPAVDEDSVEDGVEAVLTQAKTNGGGM